MVLRALIIIILVLLVGYGVREAWPLISGPQLSVSIVPATPSLSSVTSTISSSTSLASTGNTVKIDTGFISISGTATHTTEVTVDGNTVLTDQKGDFATTLTLPKGGSIITITATDRFGRTVAERRTVFVP